MLPRCPELCWQERDFLWIKAWSELDAASGYMALDSVSSKTVSLGFQKVL